LSEAELSLFGNIIRDYYRFIDSLLSLLPENTENTIDIIISDHGMQATTLENSVHLDINEILKLIHFATPALGPRPRTVLWDTTQAFNFYDDFLTKRGIFINLKEREPLGIVKKADPHRLNRHLIKKLRKIVTNTGAPLFTSVKSNPNIYDINNTQLPDIYVEINPKAYFSNFITIEKQKIPMREILWYFADITGAHKPEATIIISGNYVNSNEVIRNANIYDIAPTTLSILGIPPSLQMKGKFLNNVFSKEFLIEDKNFIVDRKDLDEKFIRRALNTQDTTLTKEQKDALMSIGYLR